MKRNNETVCRRICGLSAALVAIFILMFTISMFLTFDFSDWTNIENFQKSFRPIQMFTVIPSLLLAITYVIFISVLHILSLESRKIWSQLAMNFGLIYAGISIANYLIQLITVMPSIEAGETDGLALLVSGYPNSVFYALMASYFLMCISLLFVALVFSKNEKTQRRIRRLFQCASLAIPLYLCGAIFEVTILMISGAFCWIIGTTIGMFLVTAYFRKERLELGKFD